MRNLAAMENFWFLLYTRSHPSSFPFNVLLVLCNLAFVCELDADNTNAGYLGIDIELLGVLAPLNRC